MVAGNCFELRQFSGLRLKDLDLPASYARNRFAFAGDADAVERSTPDETLVSVGISMTGTPHVGTLGQIQSAVDLQRAGFDVQLVIADLVVYNAGGADIETVRARAERYREFALEMGFDPERGSLYTQDQARDVLHTGFLLARDYDPDAGGEQRDEQTAFEAALDAAYEDVDSSSDATAFSRDLCGLLLVADSVHPLRTGAYERVVLALGADNDGLARRADAVRERAGIDGSVVGLYSRLVDGIDDTPKMSKSVPGSSVHLDMAPDTIREHVRDPALDADRPEESVVFQMMRHASPYAGETLDDLHAACADDAERWPEAVREYADYLTDAAETWQGTAVD
jgi:tryptophanyl-tRNA synthetase